MAYAEDLKSVRATFWSFTQHPAPKHCAAKIASVHASSDSFSSLRVRVAPRTSAKRRENPTDTTTDTKLMGIERNSPLFAAAMKPSNSLSEPSCRAPVGIGACETVT
jgi:hypothetical protein